MRFRISAIGTNWLGFKIIILAITAAMLLVTFHAKAASSYNLMLSDETGVSNNYYPTADFIQVDNSVLQSITRGLTTGRFIDFGGSSYNFSDEFYSQGSQPSFNYGVDTRYASADINGDASDDLVTVQNGDLRVVFTSSSGSVKETSKYYNNNDCNAGFVLSDFLSAYPVLGDVNQDGRADALVTGNCNRFFNFNESGQPNSGSLTPIKGPNNDTNPDNVGIIADPVLGDFNNDGKTDYLLFIKYKDTNLGTYRYFIDTYMGDGTRIWNKEITSASVSILPFSFTQETRPVVADVNGDGVLDIVYSANGKVGILSLAGVSGWEVNACVNDMLASDVNGDGRLDVVVKCQVGASKNQPDSTLRVNVLDGVAGAQRANFPIEFTTTASEGLFISINATKGDTSNDIIVPTRKGIIGINGSTGAILWTIRNDSRCSQIYADSLNGNISLFAACNYSVSEFNSTSYTAVYELQDNGQAVTTSDQNQLSWPMPGLSQNRDNSRYPVAMHAADGGYHLVAADGGIFPFGDATGHGSTGNINLRQPIVGMAPTKTGNGYWLAAADGGIFPFGDAVGYGSAGNLNLWQPVVGIAPTPSGNGYWMVAADGGIFTYGDAQYYGSTGGIRLNKPIVGIAPTASGHGYWLVASDGGIFPFGDATGHGSTGNINLRQPIVGMAPTKTGNGYWLAAADGGIFPFGDAVGYGSAGNLNLYKPIVGISRTKAGNGYFMTAADGGIFTYGDAKYYGSTGDINLTRPIVGIATSQ